MSANRSDKKISAIYDLRAAAEAKAKAQTAVEAHATPGGCDALLNAQIELEVKTAEAVDACHECDEPGHDHHGGSGTPSPHGPHDQRNVVIDVDFRPKAESA